MKCDLFANNRAPPEGSTTTENKDGQEAPDIPLIQALQSNGMRG